MLLHLKIGCHSASTVNTLPVNYKTVSLLIWCVCVCEREREREREWNLSDFSPSLLCWRSSLFCDVTQGTRTDGTGTTAILRCVWQIWGGKLRSIVTVVYHILGRSIFWFCPSFEYDNELIGPSPRCRQTNSGLLLSWTRQGKLRWISKYVPEDRKSSCLRNTVVHFVLNMGRWTNSR
jgi:hypothetical protein